MPGKKKTAAAARVQTLATITDLHRLTDRRVTQLEELHAEHLNCALGCTNCCRDDLTVFTVEADRVRNHCADILRDRPHPTGACAFLDSVGACRIYEHRPYVCRTQGLPLRWLQGRDDDHYDEFRDICPLNADGIDVMDLEAGDCWTLGPVEGRLAELQGQSEVGGVERVALRDLFENE